MNSFALPYILLFMLLACANSMTAAEQAVVRIQSPKKIVSATGIIISPSGVSETTETSIQQDRENNWLISFDVKNSNSEILLVSALATTEEEANIFSPVVAFSDIKDTGYARADCLGELPSSVRQNQIGYLKALIVNRTQQRVIANNNLNKLFNDFPVEEITKLETNLGLYPGYSIEQEKNPFSLLARSFRLISALKLFEVRRQNLKKDSTKKQVNNQ